MLITCKTCSTSYHIPREVLGDDGAQLRCAGCGDIWAVTAGPMLSAQASSARFDSTPTAWVSAADDAPRHEPLPRRRFGRAAGPFALLLVVAGVMTAVGERRAIVKAAPPVARFYAAIGLPVNLREMALENVGARLGLLDDRKVLLVEGSLVNLRGVAADTPNLRIAVRGADSRELYVWTVRAPKTHLGPNEKTSFRARLATPPEGAKDVLVKFASAGDKVPLSEAGL
jgi:predicted Zn finger-like uncharacterized protein